MRQTTSIELAVIGLLLAWSANMCAEDAPARASDRPLRVAVFHDEGVSPKVAGLVELLRGQRHFDVAELKGEDVRGGRLDEFRVVIFPGGSGSGEARALQDAGRDNVRTFVERGGGYLGICAGAYLASADYDWSLHILDARVLDRQHWARGSGDVEVAFTQAGAKALGPAADRATILYWQGPLLAPAGKDAIPDYETLGTYVTEIAKNGAPQGVMPGTTAIARGTFGKGRVFCFSPHPERTQGVQHFVSRAIQWAAGND